MSTQLVLNSYRVLIREKDRTEQSERVILVDVTRHDGGVIDDMEFAQIRGIFSSRFSSEIYDLNWKHEDDRVTAYISLTNDEKLRRADAIGLRAIASTEEVQNRLES